MNFSVKIDDRLYKFKKHLILIQACLINKIDIPRFCYHEKLPIAGNCRMCLVEDIKQVKLMASCAVNIGGGMTVYTNTMKVKKAREAVLSFLLANHPLDCPICDQGGECDLQDQSLVFGTDRGRFYEYKRSVEDKDCGPLIKTIMNRCIHCTRCVRFSTTIAGINKIGVTGRGSKMEIGFYINNLMDNELSGNIIDLCPVGALTSKPSSFVSRPWELKAVDSIDILDSFGSNIRIDIRGNRIIRILPRINESINECWITDKIRFGFDGFLRQRLVSPMWRSKHKNIFVKSSWSFILKKLSWIFLNFLNYNLNIKNKIFPFQTFIGNYVDVETLYYFKGFVKNIGVNVYNTKVFNNDFRDSYILKSNVNSLKKNDLCFLVSLNLRLELTLLTMHLRKNFLKNKIFIYVIGFYSNFSFFFKQLGNSFKVLIYLFEGLHWVCSKISISKGNVHFLVSDKLDNLLNISIFDSLIKNKDIFFSIIKNNISDFSKNEFNLYNSIHSQNPMFFFNNFYYFLGFDDYLFNFRIKKNDFIIYQGSFGDVSANFSDILLPSSNFVEKNSFYLNIFGTLQKTNKALSVHLSIKEDSDILKAIAELFSFPFIKSFIFDNNIKYNNIIIHSKNKKTTIKSLLFLKNSFNVFTNFYGYDTFSRVSKTLNLCKNFFKLKNFNFIYFYLFLIILLIFF